MGFRSWWPKDEAPVCWPTNGRLICQEFPSGTVEGSAPPTESIPVDSEVGFEIHKFITYFAMQNLPESWKTNWVDMMRIWQVGTDSAPGFPDAETVAFRDPQSGQLFIAHSYGTEKIDGKTVQRGIAARVLEWMNTLTAQAYQVSFVNPVTGELTIERYADNSACPSGVNYCVGQPVQTSAAFSLRVTNYKSVIDYMRLTAAQFSFYGPNWRAIY
jgi:hypothetical protein